MKLLQLSHLTSYAPKEERLKRTYIMIRESDEYHKVTPAAFNQAGFCQAQAELLEFAIRQFLRSV